MTGRSRPPGSGPRKPTSSAGARSQMSFISGASVSSPASLGSAGVRLSRGRRVVEPFRAHGTRRSISGLVFLTVVLLSTAVLSQPNLADAADGKHGGATALSVMSGPGSDRSDFSEVPVGGPVVLRGTRPAKPNTSPASPGEIGEGYAGANTAPQQGSGDPYQQRQNNTFLQAPLYGWGWDGRYDFSGLNGVYPSGTGRY
jgi:hypothetical protein